MRYNDLQNELWRNNRDIKTLDEILGAIRASKAATEQQSLIV